MHKCMPNFPGGKGLEPEPELGPPQLSWTFTDFSLEPEPEPPGNMLQEEPIYFHEAEP